MKDTKRRAISWNAQRFVASVSAGALRDELSRKRSCHETRVSMAEPSTGELSEKRKFVPPMIVVIPNGRSRAIGGDVSCVEGLLPRAAVLWWLADTIKIAQKSLRAIMRYHSTRGR
jgi:hypothetical protein